MKRIRTIDKKITNKIAKAKQHFEKYIRRKEFDEGDINLMARGVHNIDLNEEKEKYLAFKKFKNAVDELTEEFVKDEPKIKIRMIEEEIDRTTWPEKEFFTILDIKLKEKIVKKGIEKEPAHRILNKISYPIKLIGPMLAGYLTFKYPTLGMLVSADIIDRIKREDIKKKNNIKYQETLFDKNKLEVIVAYGTLFSTGMAFSNIAEIAKGIDSIKNTFLNIAIGAIYLSPLLYGFPYLHRTISKIKEKIYEKINR